MQTKHRMAVCVRVTMVIGEVCRCTILISRLKTHLKNNDASVSEYNPDHGQRAQSVHLRHGVRAHRLVEDLQDVRLHRERQQQLRPHACKQASSSQPLSASRCGTFSDSHKRSLMIAPHEDRPPTSLRLLSAGERTVRQTKTMTRSLYNRTPSSPREAATQSLTARVTRSTTPTGYKSRRRGLRGLAPYRD